MSNRPRQRSVPSSQPRSSPSPSIPLSTLPSGSGVPRRQSTRALLSPGTQEPSLPNPPQPPPQPRRGPSQYGYNTDSSLLHDRLHDRRSSRRESAYSSISGLSPNAWESGVWDIDSGIYEALPVDAPQGLRGGHGAGSGSRAGRAGVDGGGGGDELIVWPEEKESDDWLHEPDDVDETWLERWRRGRGRGGGEGEGNGWRWRWRDSNVRNRRGWTNVLGLAFVVCGVIGVFVVWPVLAAKDRNHRDHRSAAERACAKDPMCIDLYRPLLQNVRSGLIDPDTPSSAMHKKNYDGKRLNLVFSDEFNTPNRTFYPGDDPYFTGADLWYGATEDMEYYSPLALSTSSGHLNIKFSAHQSHGLNYLSGMLQSWNQLCIRGGHISASISLPGSGTVEGLWPGFWAMGNLGRPGYLATTDGMWPYSYEDVCDVGITPNQSDPTGLSFLPGMRLPACTCGGMDHPTPGRSRSAPEIDALEASVDYRGRPRGKNAPKGTLDGAQGIGSQSFQAAPFDFEYEPDYNHLTVHNKKDTEVNVYKGGPFQQAVSGVTWLDKSTYERGGGGFATYGFEYEPGMSGKASWFIGGSYTFSLDARSVRANPRTGISGRPLPLEPMSLVLNLGMSQSFSDVFLADLNKLFPATMRVDWIRVYQEEGKESVTCDPKGWETTKYIKKHPEPYGNPELTLWRETKYDWPQNTLMNGCELDPGAARRKGGG